ncbi:hypothetical protein AVEN_244539-1 [Araneus ventricosus]|uniref:Uncharacterized protein n=1 Tax=Araneus ventricosus TaxID=182803 RepID=A0A4Y2F4H0_ARAVE|nr:hypothetical protein AVEN_244539-1 [Araneus ventricosus]
MFCAAIQSAKRELQGTSARYNLLNANEQVCAHQKSEQQTSVRIQVASRLSPSSRISLLQMLAVSSPSLPPIPMLSDILDHMVPFSKKKNRYRAVQAF